MPIAVLPTWANAGTRACDAPVRPLDYLERKLTVAQRRNHEPAVQVRRIGLVVAPAAEGHQLIQIEVGAALCAFD